ncbi:hypothetical protein [Amycolatopsis nigrescens]|uniref:hypothetical protein n=1 Tax=Amycolatopsis nigrescens TaxID=381445 RepID=UPI0003A05DD0
MIYTARSWGPRGDRGAARWALSKAPASWTASRSGTVGTIVLGAGGAIALLLAARRQQTAEQDLAHQRRVQEHAEQIATGTQAHQLRVALNTEADATERRITELYAAAVERLGSDKAPVRLGGLYALERLAQNTETQRQTIVNVLCAYLRMPYDPTPPAPRDPVDAVPVEPRPHPEDIREYVQERQVRQTAQRILAAHLHPGPDPDHPADTFWHNIDLDLIGATLIDFAFNGCHIHAGHFNAATFAGHSRQAMARRGR